MFFKKSTIYFAERLISQNKYYVHTVGISSLNHVFFLTKRPGSDSLIVVAPQKAIIAI